MGGVVRVSSSRTEAVAGEGHVAGGTLTQGGQKARQRACNEERRNETATAAGETAREEKGRHKEEWKGKKKGRRREEGRIRILAKLDGARARKREREKEKG